MAKSTITCTCTECGKTFEHTHISYNRREADNYEAWAAEHITVCPECQRKAKNAKAATEADKIISRLGIPAEITGVSDKQIAYAAKERNAYILRHREEMDCAAETLAYYHEPDTLAKLGDMAKEQGISVDELIRNLFADSDLYKEYVLLTAASAALILDTLKGK